MTPQREFWISETPMFGWIRTDRPPTNPELKDKFIHVREVNPALDKAIEGLVEALDIYSRETEIITPGPLMTKDRGRIARKALASYKAALEGK